MGLHTFVELLYVSVSKVQHLIFILVAIAIAVLDKFIGILRYRQCDVGPAERFQTLPRGK